jgi:hypothetical protein
LEALCVVAFAGLLHAEGDSEGLAFIDFQTFDF